MEDFEERARIRGLIENKAHNRNILQSRGHMDTDRAAEAIEKFGVYFPDIANVDERREEAMRMVSLIASAGDRREPWEQFQEVGERMRRGENAADVEYMLESGQLLRG